MDTAPHLTIALRFEWRNASGDLLSTDPELQLPGLNSGTYEFFITVFDGGGGATRDSIMLTIVPLKEIVLHMSNASTTGWWTLVNDTSAASGTPGAVKNDATILPATEWPYRQ